MKKNNDMTEKYEKSLVWALKALYYVFLYLTVVMVVRFVRPIFNLPRK